MSTSTSDATRARNGSRIGLTIAGTVAVLMGLAALVGGAVLVGVHETQRDGDGYYASGASAVGTPTHALVSDGLEIGSDTPDWLTREGRLGTLRVTATAAAAKPVFVGVARRVDLDAYLRGVSHDTVTDFELDPLTLQTERRAGSRTPVAPGERTFWAVVVMNADGAAGVYTDLSVGAKFNVILGVGLALLVAGGLLAVGGGTAMFLGIRPPRDRRRSAPAPAAAAAA